MARIRSIHPGILTDEAFMALTVDCPLAIPLLLGLWMDADDAGTFEWKPLTIKARILPAAMADINELLDRLCAANFIRRFDIYGKSLGVIRNFVRFQRPKTPSDVHPFTAESQEYAGFVSIGVRPPAPTGRKRFETTSEVIPNQPGITPEKRPQMEEGGGRMEQEDGKNPPSSAREPKSNFEAECRKRVGEEPVLLAMDFHEIASIIAPPDLTEADVFAGIDAAMGSKDFRPRRWKQLAGWARRAAQDRLAGQDKRTNGVPQARAGPRSAGHARDAAFFADCMRPDDDQPHDDFQGTTIDLEPVAAGFSGSDRHAPQRR